MGIEHWRTIQQCEYRYRLSRGGSSVGTWNLTPLFQRILVTPVGNYGRIDDLNVDIYSPNFGIWHWDSVQEVLVEDTGTNPGSNLMTPVYFEVWAIFGSLEGNQLELRKRLISQSKRGSRVGQVNVSHVRVVNETRFERVQVAQRSNPTTRRQIFKFRN